MRYIYITLIFFVLVGCSNKKETINENVGKLDYNILLQKTPEELRLMRNEIFAHYGFKFKSKDLQEYFGQKEWYIPKYDNVDNLLTIKDRENIDLLLKAESIIKNDEQRINYLKQVNDTLIGHLTFPVKISQINNNLGNPDSTFIDPDETCAIGQLHFWNLFSKNIKFFALGDKYGKPVDFTADCRVIGVQIINNDLKSYFPSFLGIKLNEKDNNVKSLINEFISNNNDFKLNVYDNESWFEHFIDHDISEVYIMTNGNLFFSFGFNKQKKLVYIIQSNFNFRQSC